MSVLVGGDGASVTRSAAKRGWSESAADWREAVVRSDIDVIDIVTLVDSHADIAIAVLEVGRHVTCEKPPTDSVEEAEAMLAAAERAS